MSALLYVFGSILLYIIGGSYMYGYISKIAFEKDYHEEDGFAACTFGSVFWPIAIVVLILNKIILTASKAGSNTSGHFIALERRRAENEKKIRVAVDKMRKEMEEAEGEFDIEMDRNKL